MASNGIGSGLVGVLGIGSETTYGTAAAANRWFEFNNESMKMARVIKQGAGLRAQGSVNAQLERGARRAFVNVDARGDFEIDAFYAPSATGGPGGLGLLLQNILGSYGQTLATPTVVSGAAYKQVHQDGPLQGHSFTMQIGKPDTSGTVRPFTYPGCKITDAEFTLAINELLKIKCTVDSQLEVSPPATFSPSSQSMTTSSTSLTVNSTAGMPASGTVIVPTSVTPTGKSVAYTSITATTIVFATSTFTTETVAAGAPVVLSLSGTYTPGYTGAAAGASGAYALGTAAYQGGNGLFHFAQGSLILGGTATTSAGLTSVSNGYTVGSVHGFNFKISRPLDVARWQAGAMVKSEPIDNGFPQITGQVDVEFTDPRFQGIALADANATLQLNFQGPQIGTTGSYHLLQIILPWVNFDDSVSPVVGGPGVLMQSAPFKALNDGTGTNPNIQIVYQTTDTAL